MNDSKLKELAEMMNWTDQEISQFIGEVAERLNLCKSNEKSSKMNLIERITVILNDIGMPSNLKGFNYLREAIKLAVENPEVIGKMTTMLYPMVAECFDTTPSRAERAIRHAIEVAWNKKNIYVMNKYFGETISNFDIKPSIGQFIAMIADYLQLERDLK